MHWVRQSKLKNVLSKCEFRQTNKQINKHSCVCMFPYTSLFSDTSLVPVPTSGTISLDIIYVARRCLLQVPALGACFGGCLLQVPALGGACFGGCLLQVPALRGACFEGCLLWQVVWVASDLVEVPCCHWEFS